MSGVPFFCALGAINSVKMRYLCIEMQSQVDFVKIRFDAV